MRFIQGVIVGAALTVLGAYVHDNTSTGSLKPLVNWPNASELQQASYDWLKEQFDQVGNWLKSK